MEWRSPDGQAKNVPGPTHSIGGHYKKATMPTLINASVALGVPLLLLKRGRDREQIGLRIHRVELRLKHTKIGIDITQPHQP